MRRLLYIIALAMLALSPLRAQNLETVYCRDGSEYSGYISKQIPGTVVTVNAVMARIVIPREDVKEIRSTKIPVCCLTQGAKDYLIKNDLVKDDKVEISTVTTDKSVYDEVVIVRDNKNNVTLLSFAKTTYKLAWGTIRRTSKSSCGYAPTDAVLLNSGEILYGVITDQILGSSMTLKSGKGPVNVRMSDVISVSTQLGPKEKREIWDKIPLFDCLTMNNGVEYEGLIISRLLGKSITILLRADGQEKILPQKNVKVFRKTINPAVACLNNAPAQGLLAKKDCGNVSAADSTYSSSDMVEVTDSQFVERDSTEAVPVQDESVEETSDKGNGIVINKRKEQDVKPLPKSVDDDSRSEYPVQEAIFTINGRRMECAATYFDSGMSYVVSGMETTVSRGDYVTIDVSNLYVGNASVFIAKERRVKNEESSYYDRKYPSFSHTDDSPYQNCDVVRRDPKNATISFKITKKGLFVLMVNDAYALLIEVE